MAKTAKVSSKKRKVVVEPVGEAHVCASFNNLIVTLTNKAGQVISWSSAGKMGFKGSKKKHSLRSADGGGRRFESSSGSRTQES